MRYVATLFFSILITSPAYSLQSPVNIFVSDFADESDYDGKWDLGRGIAGMCRELLDRMKMYRVVDNPGDYDVCFTLNCRIEKFSLSSRGITSYGIGGYENYRAYVKLASDLQDTKGNSLFVNKITVGDIKNHDLGLSWFGGPVGRDEDRRKLSKLWNLEFGSGEFNRSILADAIRESINNLIVQISKSTLGIPYGLRGNVADVRRNKLYLDIGSKDGVEQGMIFTVYSQVTELHRKDTDEQIGWTEPEFIGKMEITAVKGRHLSTGRILEGAGDVRKGDVVLLE